MENNNLYNTNNESPMSSSTPVNPVMHKKLSKKSLIIIIVTVLLLIALTTYYFVKRNQPKDVYIPTIEEKVNAVEATLEETQRIGLPDEKTQIDIMKFNSQE